MRVGAGFVSSRPPQPSATLSCPLESLERSCFLYFPECAPPAGLRPQTDRAASSDINTTRTPLKQPRTLPLHPDTTFRHVCTSRRAGPSLRSRFFSSIYPLLASVLAPVPPGAPTSRLETCMVYVLPSWVFSILPTSFYGLSSNMLLQSLRNLLVWNGAHTCHKRASNHPRQ